MRAAVIATLLTALLVPVSASAQAAAPPPEPTLRTFFPDLVADIRHLPSQPAGVSLAIGGILATSFEPLDDNLTQWEPRTGYKAGTWIGNPFVLAAGSLTMYGIGHWAGKPRVRHVSMDLLRAQTLSLGLVYALKYTTRRERPDETSNDSFPSGHAAQTFASATVLTRHFGFQKTWPAYALATFVTASRINQQRHFLSDAIFGAGIGVAVGWTGPRHTGRWGIAPDVSRSHAGLAITYH